MAAFTPQTTFQVKLDVSNAAGSVPTPESYEFTVTIVDACADSSLTFTTAAQADITYVIDNRTPAATTPATPIAWPTVTSTTDSTRCPVTLTYEIFTDPTWTVLETSPTAVEIQTDDYATLLADPANPVTHLVRFSATEP